MHFEVTDSEEARLRNVVRKRVRETPVDDIHTHLYDPAFGDLLLWGIDELLTYHYLVAETFRYLDAPFEDFWKLDKTAQADLVWDTLFIRRSPVSEACRGVVTCLNRLGLDVKDRDLPAIRQWFAERPLEEHIQNCMELAGVKSICMTNSPFDSLERPVWEGNAAIAPWFQAALRIDPLLLDWPNARETVNAVDGVDIASAELNDAAVSGIRTFLDHWTARMKPRYLMVSLPPDFKYPDETDTSIILEKAVLPHCRDNGLPLAVMPGVIRGVNPQLQLAGDGMGRTDLAFLRNLCAAHPDNKFAATVLSRENQHELAVTARKFRNLHIFGCWWFTNNPSIIEEMTRMRTELLGLSYTPQHSDARVLDQIIYKWTHSRAVIGEVLADKYVDLLRAGWECRENEIQRDIDALFGGEFARFCGR